MNTLQVPVPINDNDGNPIPADTLAALKRRVIACCGGLTVLPGSGYWINPVDNKPGRLVSEPVELFILCGTQVQLCRAKAAIFMALFGDPWNQHAVMVIQDGTAELVRNTTGNLVSEIEAS